MYDVPWCCATLLPPVCTGVVSVMGAGLAPIKHVWDFLGFVRLWTGEDVVVIGLQPPRPGTGSIQLRAGVRLAFVLLPERLGEKKCHLKKITALPID